MWACYKGHSEVVRLLIVQRADVNVHGQYHITPLMWAAGRGHIAIVRLLLDQGARVNTGDKVLLFLFLLLFRFCFDRSIRIHFCLIVYLYLYLFQYGTSALIWACRKSLIEIVDMLLQAGANVDVSGMVKSVHF